MAKKPVKTEAEMSGIVTSNPQGKGHGVRLARLLAAVFAVLVLAGAGYGVYQWRHDSAKTSKKSLSRAEQEAKKKFDAAFAKEQKELEAKLAAAKTPAEKSKVYIEFSNLSSAKSDPKAALEYAKKAVQADPSVDSYVALGLRARLQKDYKTAEDAYRKLLAILKQQGAPEDDRNYQTYAELLKQMQQKR